MAITAGKQGRPCTKSERPCTKRTCQHRQTCHADDDLRPDPMSFTEFISAIARGLKTEPGPSLSTQAPSHTCHRLQVHFFCAAADRT